GRRLRIHARLSTRLSARRSALARCARSPRGHLPAVAERRAVLGGVPAVAGDGMGGFQVRAFQRSNSCPCAMSDPERDTVVLAGAKCVRVPRALCVRPQYLEGARPEPTSRDPLSVYGAGATLVEPVGAR